MSTPVLWIRSAILATLAGGCEPNPPAPGSAWHELPFAILTFPSSPSSEGLCLVRLAHSRAEPEVYGVVAYTRTRTKSPGNQVVWPVTVQLCYGETWYDLQGSRSRIDVGDQAAGYDTSLHVIGSLDPSADQQWPIRLASTPVPATNHRSQDFTDDSCERIARIEGEFAGDITIHVEPAGPECDRIPYTVRYVAQELYRR